MPFPSLSHLRPDPRLELSWNGVFIHIKLKLNFLSGMNKISLLINYVKDWGRGAQCQGWKLFLYQHLHRNDQDSLLEHFGGVGSLAEVHIKHLR